MMIKHIFTVVILSVFLSGCSLFRDLEEGDLEAVIVACSSAAIAANEAAEACGLIRQEE